MKEEQIITQYFHRPNLKPQYNVLGIGDDAAILALAPETQLVTTVDTMVEGRHFLPGADPFDLGYKILAVSLSDIAAMGATPSSALLSLSLPKADPDWLARFSAGFFSLANHYEIDLVGGNLTAGPLSLTSVLNGVLPTGTALLRSGARVGDALYVTGVLGAAAFALEEQRKGRVPDSLCLERLLRPSPRVKQGLLLRGLAHSAMDISDGLLKDLSHLCQASQVGAKIFADQLPLPLALNENKTDHEAWRLALTGGEDYELLFSLPKEQGLPDALTAYCIGEIVADSKIQLIDRQGHKIYFDDWDSIGHDHFDS
jgi:thiamine-monophosphate kinase